MRRFCEQSDQVTHLVASGVANVNGRVAERRPGRVRAALLGLVLALPLVLGGAPAQADDYSELRAGHPLRIVAYILHPVGVAIDYLILRPAHWLGSKEPVKTIVGHRDD
jgi:hypothetical protein